MLSKLSTKNILIGAFFIFLMSYFLLRALFVAPLHDEVATFYHYIETGEIWGDQALKDANNHLLNSWLGYFFYRNFGEHFFLFRLPSLLAFVAYFFATKSIIEKFTIGKWKYLGFIALNTIPWITDYFSYTRGYGLAIGLFLSALYFLITFLEEKKIRHFMSCLLLLNLSVFANLTYLVISLLIISYSIIFISFHWTEWTKKQRIILASCIVLGCLLLLPLIQFSLALKEAGALYYGSLAGLWEVTGKSVSKYVLFYNENWLKIAFICSAFLGALLVFRNIRRTSFKNALANKETLLLFLIGGNIIGILFLAKVMHVNYPEDRAAMYFVPLIILLCMQLIGQHRTTRIALIGLLFFPLSFFYQMNLSTSVFSPDDRLTPEFYKKIRTQLNEGETLGIYPIMQLTTALHERNNAHSTKQIGQNIDGFYPYFDVVIIKQTNSKKTTKDSNYQLFATDDESTYCAYKRKTAFSQTLLRDTLVKGEKTTAEFVDCYHCTIDPAWRNKIIKVVIDSRFITSKRINTANFVITTENEQQQPVRYDAQNLRWFLGNKPLNKTFQQTYSFKKIGENEKLLKIYIWNPQKAAIQLKTSRIKFFELN
jgi:hypothetical protein